MPSDGHHRRRRAALAGAVAGEYLALADLLERQQPPVWDAPSLCEGWRTREVVAHVTMPARYDGPAFMAELEAAGGDFTTLSNTVAERDGALPAAHSSPTCAPTSLHGWEPPGGGAEGALTHCIIHRSTRRGRAAGPPVPDGRSGAVLALVADAARPNLFGTDLSGVELRADDLEWSYGLRRMPCGPAQVLALVACGRLLPAARLGGEAARRFSRS